MTYRNEDDANAMWEWEMANRAMHDYFPDDGRYQEAARFNAAEDAANEAQDEYYAEIAAQEEAAERAYWACRDVATETV